ncbi:unnamed protein product [Hyaloperonospora brassicae]|uniref:GATA-type domain-containing protein n=1 Tax=Hyaloperonospora brassicae TaxID=162125 RepID=A0AAV0UF03_HYABA|nr:unnamed protein product [Hyaloperonospora brassicae]
MLECQTCGAAGDSFFSENYFGEMVCELCGTQSSLQARNETLDVEDMGLDLPTALKTLKRRVTRQPKRSTDDKHKTLTKRIKREKGDNEGDNDDVEEGNEKVKQKTTPALPPLLDCVIATQMVLDAMARALVTRIGAATFPAEEYPKAVKKLWFMFLQTWGVKGTKPLLRCYNEFFLHFTHEERVKLEPAVTLDLLEQWDAEWDEQRGSQEEKQEEKEQEEQQQEGHVAENCDEVEHDTSRGGKTGKEKSVKTNVRLSGTLNKFSIVDMIGILMLASRALNLGLLPSDFADWVANGVIPYHNSLATTCADAPDVRDSVKHVSHFFQSLMIRHRANTVQIAYSANHLMYHMGLRLPPLNVPLAAHRICTMMGFPAEVFRHFQWISGFMNVTGPMPEKPLLLQAEAGGVPRFNLTPTKEDRARVDGILESEVGIVAHLVVAIKMCANWHEWIYERRHEDDEDGEGDKSDDGRGHFKSPPAAAVHNPHLLLRRDLDAYVRFAREVFVDPEHSGIPERLQEHARKLERVESVDELAASGGDPDKRLKQNSLYGYPAIHVDGILAETDEAIEERMKRLRSGETRSGAVQRADGEAQYDAFFYPLFYLSSHRSGLHAATEHVLEMLCRKIDAPIASVLPRLAELDKRMQSLVYHFERTEYHVNLLRQGQAEWKAAKKAAEDHNVVRA